MAKNKVASESVATLANNCVAFMFDEIRYELSGMEINCNRNVGITSIKEFISLSFHGSLISRDAGWNLGSDIWEGHFCVPLSRLLGFYENYKRVVVNVCHELILIRARNDNNCGSYNGALN